MYLHHWVESKAVKGFVIREGEYPNYSDLLRYMVVLPWYHCAFGWVTDRSMTIKGKPEVDVTILPEEESAILALRFLSFPSKGEL